jgi:hypothetical protein
VQRTTIFVESKLSTFPKVQRTEISMITVRCTLGKLITFKNLQILSSSAAVKYQPRYYLHVTKLFQFVFFGRYTEGSPKFYFLNKSVKASAKTETPDEMKDSVLPDLSAMVLTLVLFGSTYKTSFCWR